MSYDLITRRLENLFSMLLTSKGPLDFKQTPEDLSNDDTRLNSLTKRNRK